MLFVLAITRCELFRIKLAEDGRYTQKSLTEKDTVYLGEFKNAETYEIDYKEEKPQYKSFYPQSKKDKALGFDKKTKEIVNTGKKEHQFQLVPIDLQKRTYWIVSNDKCITYKIKDKNMILEPCYDTGKEQLFQLEPVKEKSEQKEARNEILGTMNDPKMVKILQKSAKLREIDDLVASNKSNLLSAYKGLYDLALCLGNKGFCTAMEKGTYAESTIVVKSTSTK